MPHGSLSTRRHGSCDGAAAADHGEHDRPVHGRRRPRLIRSPRLRRALTWSFRGMLALVLIVTGYVGVTLYPYLSGPGTDSVSARTRLRGVAESEGVDLHPPARLPAARVFHRDGSLAIGAWGTGGLTMTPNVLALRENLSLLVRGGVVQISANAGSGAQGGYTINNDYYIARSGIGVTASGDVVYVSGSALSVATLAQLLKAAGAVDAMELDINPDWVSFMTYSGNRATPDPIKLWDFVQPADRYLQPASRDFVSVHLR